MMQDVEKAPQRPSSTSSSNPYWAREHRREDLWKAFLFGWIFVCGLAGATFAIACMRVSRTTMAADEAFVPTAVLESVTQITTSAPSIVSPSAVSVVSSVSSAAQHSLSISTSCGPKKDVSSLVFEPNPLGLNQSDQFTAHVIGDNHVIIRPPQKYLLLRRPPTLFVEVTRGEEKLGSELSKPLEGVYTLELNSEESWGLLKISISTKSRPLINETLEVDFGSPWLKFSGWMKVVAQRKMEFQSLVEQAKVDANQIASDFGNIAGRQVVEAKDAVVAKARDVASEASRLYQGTKYADVKVYLPSVGKSEYVKKAQQQAKVFWERKREELLAMVHEDGGHWWLRR
jgi:hypothetical protein